MTLFHYVTLLGSAPNSVEIDNGDVRKLGAACLGEVDL